MPATIHAKLMTIDGLWSMVGSTNFDHRSFALNDEVNLAVRDRELAGVFDADLESDLNVSHRLSEGSLRGRGVPAVLDEVVGHAMRFES
jgi:cardiolipin synthase